jgi:hypothetical protein
VTSFVALYRGHSIASAELVAVTADRGVVAQVATLLLDHPQFASSEDPAIAGIARAKRRALAVVGREASKPTLKVLEGKSQG